MDIYQILTIFKLFFYSTIYRTFIGDVNEFIHILSLRSQIRKAKITITKDDKILDYLRLRKNRNRLGLARIPNPPLKIAPRKVVDSLKRV